MFETTTRNQCSPEETTREWPSAVERIERLVASVLLVSMALPLS